MRQLGKIVAVSVGQPRTLEINGVRMSSSIARAPAKEAVHFTLEGPHGNATAIHTEQVCVFCAERYDHWSRMLGIARASWGDCFFGENLMIAGLDEETVHVGERFRTSRGALMEVTGPRSNCAKLTWRMGTTPDFLQTLVKTGWIGYYLRVIEPGWIAAGDEVWIETLQPARAARPGSISIAALTRAIHDTTEPDLAVLRAAAAEPAVGRQTSEVLRKRIRDAEDVWRTSLGRWPDWRPFVIVARRAEAQDACSVWLEPADHQSIAPYRAGQHITVRMPLGDAPGTTRLWSLSEYEPEPRRYRITVKRERQGPLPAKGLHPARGRASQWIQEAPLGTGVELRPPSGRFVLDRGTLRRVILVSAGIGVTPLLAMLQAHLDRGDDGTPLIWMHSTRSSATHVLREETQALIDSRPNIRRIVHYTEPLPQDQPGRDFDVAGRMSAAAIAASLAAPYALDLIGRPVQVAGNNNEVYLCGPDAFERDMRAAFIAANVVPHYIRSESFHPRFTGGSHALPVNVRFSRRGIERPWTEAAGSLLELALAAGINASYGCKVGGCGACLARLVSGEVTYDPAPDQPIPAGHVLLCCARPSGAEIVIDL